MGCSGDGLFGRGIRILLFHGGSPVFFFVGLFRVRTLRLFIRSGVHPFRRSGCSVFGRGWVVHCSVCGYYSVGVHTYIVFHRRVPRPAVR